METPDIHELVNRIHNHLYRSGSTTEVTHLWSGYLAALIEWGLIGQEEYEWVASLIGGVREAELYQVFADGPMPGLAGPLHRALIRH